MAKFVTEKKNNKQLENAYILYMIFASYFHKCICRTQAAEKRLFMYYKEMASGKQDSMEIRAIEAADKVFAGWEDVMKVSDSEAYILQQGDKYIIHFRTGLEALSIEVDKKGKFRVTKDWAAKLAA